MPCDLFLFPPVGPVWPVSRVCTRTCFSVVEHPSSPLAISELAMSVTVHLRPMLPQVCTWVQPSTSNMELRSGCYVAYEKFWLEAGRRQKGVGTGTLVRTHTHTHTHHLQNLSLVPPPPKMPTRGNQHLPSGDQGPLASPSSSETPLPAKQRPLLRGLSFFSLGRLLQKFKC